MIAREVQPTTQIAGVPGREHFTVYPQTVVEVGIDAVPDTFLSLLRGAYRGNVSVRLA